MGSGASNFFCLFLIFWNGLRYGADQGVEKQTCKENKFGQLRYPKRPKYPFNLKNFFWQSEIENICRNSQFFPIAHTVFIIYKMEKNEVVSIIFQAEGHTSPLTKRFYSRGRLALCLQHGSKLKNFFIKSNFYLTCRHSRHGLMIRTKIVI